MANESKNHSVSWEQVAKRIVDQSIVPPAWLLGARTRAVDSWSPQPEIIQLPAIHRSPAELTFYAGQGTTHLGLPQSLAGRLKRAVRKDTRLPPLEMEGIVCDLRFDDGKNFAHALIWTGLMALAARQVAFERYGKAEFTAVISGGAADYVTAALRSLGLNVLSTYRPVRGLIVRVDEKGHLPLIRLSNSLLEKPHLRNSKAENKDLEKIYISRRGSRTVQNEEQVFNFLSSLGYKRVYPEDMPVEEQILLLTQSTDIVAIHGAALGPLLLRPVSASTPGPRIVELFGAGFIVTVFREIVSELSGTWIGVRGELTPNVVGNTRGALYFEKDSFSVDIDCLAMAIDALHRADGRPQHRWEM